jgi:methyl-accepting chemotaxis protein
MKKPGISLKLYLSFGVLLLFLLIMSLFFWSNTIKSQNLFTEYADQVGAGIFLSNAERGMWELRFGVANFMSADEKGQKKIIADGPKWYAQVEDNLKAYASGNRTPEEKAVLTEWEEIFPKYKAARDRWFEIFQSGKIEEAKEFRAQNTNRYGAASVKALSQMMEIQKSIGDAREKNGLAESRRTRTIVIWLLGISLVLGLALSILISRSITRPLTKTIAGLTDGADQVSSSSDQVSSASQALAEGASEQAAGLEETSSSIEEMASMTKQNADNATQANTLMRETNKVVEEANQSMKELTQSMLEISNASEETGKIIKTIDEIAFQTNLLALNAAVEAARAGEAGAGFAVVADEVRNLAMRAAEAAKNTSYLIEGTVKKIKNGSDVVTKTNEAFGKVAGGSRKVAELVGEIAAASNEQAQGIDQINKAVSKMDRVVQQNSASAEESASAAEEMNAQAGQMKDYVGELIAVLEGNIKKPEGIQDQRREMTGRKTLRPKIKTGFQRALPEPTRRNTDKRLLANKTKEIKPQQLFPLENDEFKKF